MAKKEFSEEEATFQEISFWDVNPEEIRDLARRESVIIALGGENRLRSFMLASPEQLRLAQEVGKAILEGPLAKNPLHPLTRDDLHLVVAGSFEDHKDGNFSVIMPDGKPRVAYLVSTKGFDLTKDPSFVDPETNSAKMFNEVYQRQIMSKQNDRIFKVEVNGRSYDTRLGMDEDGYKSMVFDRLTRGQRPPEVGSNSVTLLTGMPMDSSILFASSYTKYSTGLAPHIERESIWYSWRGNYKYNFRPAVKL